MHFGDEFGSYRLAAPAIEDDAHVDAAARGRGECIGKPVWHAAGLIDECGEVDAFARARHCFEQSRKYLDPILQQNQLVAGQNLLSDCARERAHKSVSILLDQRNGNYSVVAVGLRVHDHRQVDEPRGDEDQQKRYDRENRSEQGSGAVDFLAVP